MRPIRNSADIDAHNDYAPAIRFEMTSQEDRILSEQTKKPEFMNVINVFVRAHGDMKTEVIDIAEMTGYDAYEKEVDVERTITKYVEDPESGDVKEVPEKMTFREKRTFYKGKQIFPWLDKLKDRHKHGQIGERYLDHCVEAFNRFKKNQDLPANGYALINWRGIDPATRDKLIGMGINTVELVANMTEEAMQYVGMGARALQQKAQAFLLQNNAPEQAAIEMTQLRQQNESMAEILSAMQSKLADLSNRQQEKSVQDTLRAKYTEVTGNSPDMRWGAKKLIEEIESAEKSAEKEAA